MKQNDLFPKDGFIKNQKEAYEAPFINIEEVIVEQGYAGSVKADRGWVNGGELKNGYED